MHFCWLPGKSLQWYPKISWVVTCSGSWLLHPVFCLRANIVIAGGGMFDTFLFELITITCDENVNPLSGYNRVYTLILNNFVIAVNVAQLLSHLSIFVLFNHGKSKEVEEDHKQH